MRAIMRKPTKLETEAFEAGRQSMVDDLIDQARGEITITGPNELDEVRRMELRAKARAMYEEAEREGDPLRKEALVEYAHVLMDDAMAGVPDSMAMRAPTPEEVAEFEDEGRARRGK